MNDQDKKLFANEVKAGLSSRPKSLPSKWFYDEKGDDLFVQIMHLDEYYLTDCEYEIFKNQSDEIIESLGESFRSNFFELIELGAGDGTKTIELLKNLKGHRFVYRPLDISASAIHQLEGRIKSELPSVDVKGLQGEYFQVLSAIAGEHPKIILFLGSNLGNMKDEQASQFLKGLSNSLKPGDMIILGTDQKKSGDIVLPAYNDSKGVTASFNLNLLSRINRELDADFDVSNFRHVPEYDEEEGVARSYLVSRCKQRVEVGAIDLKVELVEGEQIQTEVSRKYDRETLDRLLIGTNLKVKSAFTDRRKYFVDYLLERVD